MISDRETTPTAEVSYDELLRQHREYETRLHELTSKAWLTPDEEIEEKRIKKLKLLVKDQLASLRSQG